MIIWLICLHVYLELEEVVDDEVSGSEEELLSGEDDLEEGNNLVSRMTGRS